MARRSKKGKANRELAMTTHKTTGGRPFGKGRKGGKRKGSRY